MMGAKHRRPVAPPGRQGNPLLNQLEAMYTQREQQSLRYADEVDRMAFCKFIHEKFQVGPGRAEDCLKEYTELKHSIPKRLLAESMDDPEVLVYKRDWATYLKGVFGESWEGCRNYFMYLQQYW